MTGSVKSSFVVLEPRSTDENGKAEKKNIGIWTLVLILWKSCVCTVTNLNRKQIGQHNKPFHSCTK